jgi:hypothetical protein
MFVGKQLKKQRVHCKEVAALTTELCNFDLLHEYKMLICMEDINRMSAQHTGAMQAPAGRQKKTREFIRELDHLYIKVFDRKIAQRHSLRCGPRTAWIDL